MTAVVNDKFPVMGAGSLDLEQESCSLHVHPQVLHFPAYELGAKHTQKITLINQGATKVRVQLRSSNNRAFDVKHNKKAYIHPGGSEQISVTFSPTEWRYFYDCLRISTDAGDRYTVPIHAYPVMNKIDIPRKIDMGKIPLHSSKLLTIPLECSVPVDFEFKVNVLEMSPKTAWTVSPTFGIVKAQGRVDLVISFTPINMQTCQLKFELSISQFGFEPIYCEIYGMGIMPREEDYLPTTINVHNSNHKSLKAARLQYIREFESQIRKSALQTGELDPITQKMDLPVISQDIFQAPINEIGNAAEGQPQIVKSNKVKRVKNVESSKNVVNQSKSLEIDQNKDQTDVDKVAATKFHKEVMELRNFEQLKELRRFVCLGEDDTNREMSLSVPVPEPPSPSLLNAKATTRTTSRINADYSRLVSTYNEDIGRWFDKYTYQRMFMEAIWTVIIRLRAEKRLRCLRKLIRGGKMGKEETKKSKDEPSYVVAHFLTNLKNKTTETPVSDLQAICRLVPADIPDLKKFKFSQIVELKKHGEYELLGFEPITITQFAPYQIDIEPRSLRFADNQNQNVEKADSKELLNFKMPNIMQRPLRVNMRNLYPGSGWTMCRPLSYTESDPEYILSAKDIDGTHASHLQSLAVPAAMKAELKSSILGFASSIWVMSKKLRIQEDESHGVPVDRELGSGHITQKSKEKTDKKIQ